MSRMIRTTILLTTLLACVGCDQLTKAAAKEWLPPGERMSFLGDTFRLQYSENTGAFLSLGSTIPDQVRIPLLITATGGVLLFCIGVLLFAYKIPFSTALAIALLTGGGIGNLLDRLLYNGSVVDFLNLGIRNLRTGIFNVADIAIMAGMILVILRSFKHQT